MFFSRSLFHSFYQTAHDLCSRRTRVDMGGYAKLTDFLPFRNHQTNELNEALLAPDFIHRMCALALPDYSQGKVETFANDPDFKTAFRLLFEHQYFDHEGKVVMRTSRAIPALYHNIQVMCCFKDWLDSLPQHSPLYIDKKHSAYKGVLLVALLHDLYEDSHTVRIPDAKLKAVKAAQERLDAYVRQSFTRKLGNFVADGVKELTNPPQERMREMPSGEKTDKFIRLINHAVAYANCHGRGFVMESYLAHLVMIKTFDKGNNIQSDIDGFNEARYIKMDKLEEKAERTKLRFKHLGKLGKRFDPAVRKQIRYFSRQLSRSIPYRKRCYSVKRRFMRSTRRFGRSAYNLFLG